MSFSDPAEGYTFIDLTIEDNFIDLTREDEVSYPLLRASSEDEVSYPLIEASSVPLPQSPALSVGSTECAICECALRPANNSGISVYLYSHCGCIVCGDCVEASQNVPKDVIEEVFCPKHDRFNQRRQSALRVFGLECSICLSTAAEKFAETSPARVFSEAFQIRTSCGHIYCLSCLNKWTRVSYSHRCPLCRSSMDRKFSPVITICPAAEPSLPQYAAEFATSTVDEDEGEDGGVLIRRSPDLRINNLIRKTTDEYRGLNDHTFFILRNKDRFSPAALAVYDDLVKDAAPIAQRLECLTNVRRYILDHEIEGTTGSPYDTPLLAIRSMIEENRSSIASTYRRANQAIEAGVAFEFWAEMYPLRREQKGLQATLNYILSSTETS